MVGADLIQLSDLGFLTNLYPHLSSERIQYLNPFPLNNATRASKSSKDMVGLGIMHTSFPSAEYSISYFMPVKICSGRGVFRSQSQFYSSSSNPNTPFTNILEHIVIHISKSRLVACFNR